VTARRRRGLLLLCVALASGGLAASQVRERERRAAERLGPQVEVLVAARDIPAGARVARATVGVRRVPARFVPPDALPAPEAVVGARTAGRVAAGGYLTASLFEEGIQGEDAGLGRGERAVTVEVAGANGVAALQPGARVDVLVSTETGAAGGRTTMALAGAELLRVEAGTAGEYGGGETADGAPDPTASGPVALATLRVSVDQAIYLTAADNFAREIRLLPRPRGDHSRAGGSVSQGQL
jgi:pilus assembly protein CpaB